MQLIQSDKVLCIDPGTTHSGVVEFDGLNVTPVSAQYDNRELITLLRRIGPAGNGYVNHCVIEMIACYGMPVGREVFETCVWIGRLQEAFTEVNTTLIYRKDVKLFLCGTHRAKDGNVRQALLDLFPRSGGGKTPQVGTAKEPGPLYGVKSHIWAALSLGVFYKYGRNALEPPLTGVDSTNGIDSIQTTGSGV